jgi:cytoskeletal protein RodZ
LLPHGSDKRLKLDIVFFKPMRTIIIAGFVLALASGLFLNYPGHQWQVLAQTNSTTNATQGSTGASNATQSSGASGNTSSQSQGASQGSSSSSGGGGGNKSTTPESTVATMKSGPKAAGSASQLQQIEGPNATSMMSSNTPVGNKPGMQGLASEGNTTSQSNATSSATNSSGSSGSAAQNATSGAGSAAQNATSGAGSAAQNATSGAGSAAGNASSSTQGKNSTNPLAKIPVIGKLFGG